jgi:hypothetical protein
MLSSSSSDTSPLFSLSSSSHGRRLAKGKKQQVTSQKRKTTKKARVILLSSSSSSTLSLSKNDLATQKVIHHEFKKMKKKFDKKIEVLMKSVLDTRKNIKENLSSQDKYKNMVVNADLLKTKACVKLGNA